MPGSIEKAGGRVGIVGTGHRARVCFWFLFLLLFSLSLFFLSSPLFILLMISPSSLLLLVDDCHEILSAH